MKSYNLINCPCLDVRTEEEIGDYISSLIRDKKGGYSTAINALKIVEYNKNTSLRQVIGNALFNSPDGFGVVLAFRWLYGLKVIKLDLPGLILDLASEKGYRVFLLGTNEENNRLASEKIKVQYPGLCLVGRLNGYFSDIAILKESLKKANPQIVLIAMGSPKQEILSAGLFQDFPHILFIGCDGRLDILAGKLKRAPQWYINNNIEWFYRLIKQPKRLKQQIKLVYFLAILIKEWLLLKVFRNTLIRQKYQKNVKI